MNKSNYEKYKDLKSEFDYEYRGFNMGQVMAMDLAQFVYGSNNKNYLPKIYNYLFKIINLDQFNDLINENKPLYTYVTKRDDYYELVKDYMVKIGDNCDIICLNDLESKKNFNLKGLFTSLWFCFKIEHISVLQKLYLSFMCSYYKNLIDYLLALDVVIPSKYVAFNSSTRLETLLTLYFNMKNVETFSLQHGFDYLKKPLPINIINFENITASNVLCWGQYTIEQMVKFGVDRDRLVLFGNPKYDLIQYIHKPKIRKVLVALSRVLFEDGNIKLIDIISKLSNIKFELKLHPSLDSHKYYKISENFSNISVVTNKKTVKELLRNHKYDLALTYNTTVHYEAFVNGKLSFGYDFESDGAKLFEKFADDRELKKLILKYENLENDKINNEIENFAQYTLGINKLSNL